ncbi:hypothetical protein GUITHDRAFT_102363 [Guillardia theta CCMP2712]|uniref:Uncharacterized protein n=1 Tax=Guillardia theta (strain CCMP2712) TaxID=905079 RepID=L1JT64_GUITC|nr:hypothetical protein GUITHDRAFT_102363 [Guillardia theta CCMP2712]EKX51756.1 hypothetical protein GUITHDRAFT_102363 [Guillardia theta CCMP2712]|eukprot:XP_005838736.1 hypothetical protein GUITHDRAFT_102363 [Guillardia theta CCMP2712]
MPWNENNDHPLVVREDTADIECSSATVSAAEHQQQGIECCESRQNNTPSAMLCSHVRFRSGTARIRSGLSIASAFMFVAALMLVAKDALVEDTSSTGKRVMLQGDGALMGSALKDVQQLYKSNPKMIEEWAMLTGNKGEALLHLLQSQSRPRAQRDVNIRRGTSKLNQYLHELKLASEEERRASESRSSAMREGRKSLSVQEPVEKHTAWILVNDLSREWDRNANYTRTPWEFCAGRDLSGRQLRDCVEHLMRAVGVKYHRDLNMDSKLYDDFCSQTGHTILDKHGSPTPIPRGTRRKCIQITMYKTKRNRVTGALTPPAHELKGSHGIDCSVIPDGC